MDNLARQEHSSALYAFSADPITYGHINIVERMATSFSRCIVGIGRNPAKQYLFDLEERQRLAKVALAHLTNVEVMAFEGMVVDFAYEQGAKVIVKGIRTATDMEYEQTLHHVGASQNLGIDTHILFADPLLAHVSSSVVKGMQLEHGFIQEYVPSVVKAALEARLSGQLIIGLTGDIASGKSTLANQLVDAGRKQKLDVHNIDLDKLGHQILAGVGIGEPIYRELKQELVSIFTDEILNNGKISRPVLATKIFDNERSRARLNALMAKPMAILLRKELKTKKGIVLLNGALLADLGLLGLCNYRTVLCEVESEEQIARLKARGLSRAKIQKRLSAQLDSAAKMELIKKEITENNFGKIWRYTHDKLAVEELLQLMFGECKEFEWKV